MHTDVKELGKKTDSFVNPKKDIPNIPFLVLIFL